ncbi:MAG: hypothetical protein OXH11_15190 [Candidatus Aminicenantes bacterium]|nr:hypothetical protein [Candidatus Aminicenantes bacterium]
MQHSHRPVYRSKFSWRGSILAVSALLALVTGNPVIAASDDSVSDEKRAYTGIFAGSALMGNKIVDVEGFANWGQPGYWTSDGARTPSTTPGTIGVDRETPGVPVLTK